LSPSDTEGLCDPCTSTAGGSTCADGLVCTSSVCKCPEDQLEYKGSCCKISRLTHLLSRYKRRLHWQMFHLYDNTLHRRLHLHRFESYVQKYIIYGSR